LAKRTKITCEVRLQATVDAERNLTAAKVIGGSRAVVNAAKDAVHKWKFAPGTRIDRVDVPVNFATNQ
jgi:TonB family protein